jgi:hypothetical protein
VQRIVAEVDGLSLRSRGELTKEEGKRVRLSSWTFRSTKSHTKATPVGESGSVQHAEHSLGDPEQARRGERAEKRREERT